VFVIGGTAVPGQSYVASYRIPPQTWIYPAVQTWTQSRDYDLTPLTPTSERPAYATGNWCWFN
jgi:hypothetical protein